ncbi:CsbD family protein [Rhizosaccharibacter radicis]|uniref:CsbD family protein n=1 Tax=Rhizosaccharibacter radicis TaxID=2782605 RepID=A0ABT1VXH8_9PROT|nr:CsbD family protein [Acetobacteraceae bacterium KSS12]
MVDSNKVEGVAEDVVGKVQDGMGGLLGDTATQAKGKARQFAGQAQGYYGDTLDTVRDVTSDQPIVALLAALGLGFLVGAIFGRR